MTSDVTRPYLAERFFAGRFERKQKHRANPSRRVGIEYSRSLTRLSETPHAIASFVGR
jgi:hypothetical protein